MTRPVQILLGGAFDPPHIGHLHLLWQALARARGEHRDARVEASLLPTGSPPHRAAGRSFGVRLDLCRAAVAGIEEFSVCAVEGELPAPTYTSSTLEALTRARPDTDFIFLIGADQYLQFPQWHRSGRILELAEIWVFPRPGHPLPEIPPPFRVIDAPLLEISSTWLRTEFAAGRPPRFLVPEAVLSRVLALDLYVESEI